MQIQKQSTKEKAQGSYLYCIIPSGTTRTFGNIGMSGSKVYTIPFGDVSAVVSSTPMQDYELNEENTRTMESVLRRVMEDYPLIPTEFGTTLKSKAILRTLIKKAHKTLKECLKLVDGQTELGVKVVQKRGVNLTPQKRDNYASDILKSLEGRAEQLKKGGLFSNMLLLNASFLVKTNGIDEFSKEVDELVTKYEEELKFLYSGPWAPYNFVYIRIGKEGLVMEKGR